MSLSVVLAQKPKPCNLDAGRVDGQSAAEVTGITDPGTISFAAAPDTSSPCNGGTISGAKPKLGIISPGKISVQEYKPTAADSAKKADDEKSKAACAIYPGKIEIIMAEPSKEEKK